MSSLNLNCSLTWSPRNSSGYVDLIITGLIGLISRDDDTLELRPLAPATWDYFGLDEVPYRGHSIAVVWDRLGTRYGLGKGLHLLVDGMMRASSPRLERLSVTLPERRTGPRAAGVQQATRVPRARVGHTFESGNEALRRIM